MCPEDSFFRGTLSVLRLLQRVAHSSCHRHNQPENEKTADILSDNRKYFIPLLPQTGNKSIMPIRGK